MSNIINKDCPFGEMIENCSIKQLADKGIVGEFKGIYITKENIKEILSEFKKTGLLEGIDYECI